MKYLLLILLFITPAPAPAMQRLDQTEHPIRTVRRIKKQLRKQHQVVFTWVGWGLWLLAIILFTIWQGWLWLLWFAAGCVVLLVLVEGINSLTK